jgi:hypothetical protein
MGACGVGEVCRLEGDGRNGGSMEFCQLLQHRKSSNVTRSDEMRQAEGRRYLAT